MASTATVAKTSCQKRLFVAIVITAALLAVYSYTILQSQADTSSQPFFSAGVGNTSAGRQRLRGDAKAVVRDGLVTEDVVVKELPDFWHPAEGIDVDAPGRFVEGQPTIFVGIASYRDPLCHSTLNDALKWADYPRRLVFGVAEQNANNEADDLRCDFTPKPCEEDPTQLLCIHRSQIRLLRLDAKQARGPCFGRHRSERLYRGEHYALQLDAHMFFVKGWDTKIIAQWKETGNEYAVLSTYPSDYKNTISQTGEGLTNTAPLICSSKFEPDGMVRHNAAGEVRPIPAIVGRSPILVPLWGAGISFSRGHRIVRVPYDCCLDMMFSGEEFSMAVRMWTHGYDFYSPYPSVAFHWYNRPHKPRTFWENTGRAPGASLRSARRVLALLGAPPDSGDYDSSGIGVGERYGLGTQRPLALFMELFGYDVKKRTARNNCPWVFSQAMHKELVPHLRPDRKGIDYSAVPVNELVQRYFPPRREGRTCKYRGPVAGFLAGCCQQCRGFSLLTEAQAECSQDTCCSGIVVDKSGLLQMREGNVIYDSPAGEKSYIREDCDE